MAKSKPIPGITCDAEAAAAIRAVVTARLDEMCALRDAALDWSEPEGVHDMRVASRRLRSALRDFSPYLRKRLLTPLVTEIKTIADALGMVRDYDVAIIGLEKIANHAPSEVSHGIRRFADFRRAGQAEARVKLLPELEPTHLAGVKSQFEESFEKGFFAAPVKKKAVATPAYREIAGSICLDRLQELEKLSGSLYKPFTIKPLHKMRIAAKHLRYALELFKDCLGEPSGQTAKKVARLQSSLGGLHDCDTWIEDFGNSAQLKAPNPDLNLKETSVWLINYFIKDRAKHHRKALALWLEWEGDGISAALRKNFKGHSKARK